MGYWEQVAEDNLKDRERVAAMSPVRRMFREWWVWVIGILLWSLILAPFWMPFVRGS